MKLLVWIPIVSEIGKALLALLMVIDSWVYNLISSSYKIFMALSGARLLSSDAFSTIANKLYIVVGVVMLFVLSYAIIKAIIDPDQMTKGELGGPKLIKGVLIAVIGLGIAPVLFNMLYQAQGIILENNVLGKIFFRSEDNKVELKDTSYTDDEGNTINIKYEENEIVPDDILSKSGGALVATHVWQAFFYPASGNMEDAKDIKTSAEDYFNNNGTTGAICGAAGGVAAATAVAVAAGAIGAIFTLGGSLLIAAAAVGAGMACYNASDAIDEAYAEITNGKMSLEQAYVISASEGDFGIYTNFLDEVSGDESSISYIFIISTIVGGVVLYAFISFSIDMGVRCAKLAYYQIIAPIPLILQILPKFKDSFSKYVKGVFSTFLEVFIRISVVYVVVYIICHLTDLFSTAGVWKNLGAAEALFARVLLVVGLVIFAKQAPKMIQETFGIQSGSMSLGIGKKLADGGALAVGGVLGAGLMGAVNGFSPKDPALQRKGLGRLTGAIGGAGRGLWYGIKENKKKPVDSYSGMAEQWRAGGEYQREKLKEKQDLITENMKDKNGNDRTASQAYVAGKLDKIGRKTKRFVYGASNVDSEKAAMDILKESNDLKGKLREEALKKDPVSKALKLQLDDLSAKEISEYKDGWTKETYQQELGRRLSSDRVDDEFSRKLFDLTSNGQITDAAVLAKIQNYQRELANCENKRRDLETLKSRLSNPSLTDAERTNISREISRAESQLVTHEADLITAREQLDNITTVNGDVISIDKQKEEIVANFAKEAKRSESEMSKLRMEHAKKTDAIKKALEEANDMWVNQRIADGQNDFINKTMSEFAESVYKKLPKGGNQVFKIGDDEIRVADYLESQFGAALVNEGKFVYDGVFKQNGVEVTIGDVRLKLKDGEYYQFDPNDHRESPSGSFSISVSNEDLVEMLSKVEDRDAIKEQSSLETANDYGKKGESYIRTHQYTDKVKEMEEENKDKK